MRYIEVRFSPILHTRHGLSLKESVDAARTGLERAERETGIQTGIILCGIRHISPESCLVLAQLALEYKSAGVVGFDLAGAEEHFPAKKHREAFFLILNNNINCTVHAGEAFGPASIAQAVHYCGAHRIGHGTRLREDPDLMDYVNDHRIALEMCLSSNVQTGAVDTLGDHPVKYYLNEGLRVTLNTDNRLMSDTTLTQGDPAGHPALRPDAARPRGDPDLRIQERLPAAESARPRCCAAPSTRCEALTARPTLDAMTTPTHRRTSDVREASVPGRRAGDVRRACRSGPASAPDARRARFLLPCVRHPAGVCRWPGSGRDARLIAPSFTQPREAPSCFPTTSTRSGKTFGPKTSPDELGGAAR